MSATSPVKLVPRRSDERGHADHGWLKTFHTWNFASYQSRQFQQFGALRVMNEDRVEPKEGFGTHSHREFEIFSYIVSGELEHRDSMGNVEIMKRGDVQLTSAGTGISHSEKTYGDAPVHFLQIWSIPSKSRLSPAYYTRHFTDAEKTNKLLPIVAPIGSRNVTDVREGTGPTPISQRLQPLILCLTNTQYQVHSPVTLYATILSPGTTVTHTFPAPSGNPERKAYVHLIQTSGYNPGNASGGTIKLNSDLELREGDGAFATSSAAGATIAIENAGSTPVEVLVFDIE